MARRRHHGQERRIALERMGTLFRLAEQEAIARRDGRARRYVELARRIGTRHNVRVPREFKRKFCRGCGAYFVPPQNVRVRVGRGKIVVTCLACGSVQRMPYLREQVARRARKASGQ